MHFLGHPHFLILCLTLIQEALTVYTPWKNGFSYYPTLVSIYSHLQVYVSSANKIFLFLITKGIFLMLKDFQIPVLSTKLM